MHNRVHYDYSPVTAKEKELYHTLDQIYDYQKNLYRLYGRMRFRGAEFMKDPTPELFSLGEESVAEHMFSAVMFWEMLYPNLTIAEIIDTSLVSFMILIHDLGEIAQGDVSAVLQLQGAGKDRQEIETNAFTALTNSLPKPSQTKMRELYERYEREKNDPQTRDKESLMAKVLDMLQGNHFVLTYGTNMQKNAPIHAKIIAKKLLPYAMRLETILIEEENETVATEIHTVIKHHLYQYQKLGGEVPSDFFSNKK